MPAKESFDIDGLMVFRSDLTAVDQDGNIVAGVITPDRYLPSDREPLSDVQIGRYTNTTAYWKDHSDIVPANGDVYIYSDGATEEQGGVTVNIPKIKVGDGVTTIGNLPFTDSDTASMKAIAGLLSAAADKHFTYEWRTLQDVVEINHNLHKKPSVIVVDTAGTELFCDVAYTDDDNVTLTFSEQVRGTAYFN